MCQHCQNIVDLVVLRASCTIA